MGLSSNSLKNSREGAEASFSTAEAGGVRIVRSGPDAVAELASELPELPPPFADTIARSPTFPSPPSRDTMIPFSRGLIMHVHLVRDRDRSKEEGSGGAQEGPQGDRANEMRSIANARRPGAGHEALCSSLRARARARARVCVCVSLLVNLYQSYFFFGTRVRLIAWTPGSRAQGGVCDWIGHHATALVVCCHVTQKRF